MFGSSHVYNNVKFTERAETLPENTALPKSREEEDNWERGMVIGQTQSRMKKLKLTRKNNEHQEGTRAVCSVFFAVISREKWLSSLNVPVNMSSWV